MAEQSNRASNTNKIRLLKSHLAAKDVEGRGSGGRYFQVIGKHGLPFDQRFDVHLALFVVGARPDGVVVEVLRDGGDLIETKLLFARVAHLKMILQCPSPFDLDSRTELSFFGGRADGAERVRVVELKPKW